MTRNNTLYVKNKEMSNVIIETDAHGHNAITRREELKYNKLVNTRNAACTLRKNIVIIDNKDVTETIIEADACGNNTVKSFDDYAKEEMDTNVENIFKDLLIKTRKKNVQESLIDVYLTEKRESLQGKLKKATEFYKAGLFAKANELYENALDAIKYDSYPDEFMLNDFDIFAIKFGLVLSKIGVNDYASLHTAEEILISLIDKYGNDFPSLFYYLAKVLYNLNHYKRAQILLEDGLKVLDSLDYVSVLNWPGTKDDMVEKSTKTFLVQNMIALLNKCKVFHMPDLKCFFHPCEEDNDIFFTNLRFTGYVALKCTNKCNFTYHRCCWKRKLKQDGVKKTNSLLDQTCTTDDCHGFLHQILIYDESLRILSTTTSSSNKDQSKGVKNGCKIALSTVDKTSKPDESKTKKEDKIKTEQSEKDGNIAATSVADKQDLSRTEDAETENLESNTTETTQRNKFPLNTNAKEYVPSNFKLYDINIWNNKIQIDEEETEENKMLSSNLNTNAKEYIPSLRVINMLSENTVTNYCEKFTQTAEKVVNQADYDMLKCEVTILQTELFKTEENYNNVLLEISSKQLLKTSTSTETDPTICETCVLLNSNLKDRDEAYSNIISLNEQLEYKVRNLKEEITVLKDARLLDKELVMQNERKFIESNKVLVQKLQELTAEKEKLLKESRICKTLMETNSELPSLKKILLDQISHIINFYLSYIAMFDNKCKHMIWELEDVKALTTADSLPSSTEIEENLIMWRQSLDTCAKYHSIALIFFDKLIKKFTTHPEENLLPTPIPCLIPEPPSVIFRHFKSFFAINKRLENDLNRHMANYYKMISMPFPGPYPYNMPQSPIPLQIESYTHFERRDSIGSVEAEVQIHPPPGLGREPVRVNQEEISEDISADKSLDTTMNFSFVSNPENTPEVENITTIISSTSAESSTETTNLNQTEAVDEAISLPTTKQEKETKAVIVGPDRLIYKLQQKYPITPPRILQDAVQILRSSRGGLTGLDSKTMMSELRKIISELTKVERQKPGYQKISVKEKASPWAPINNSVQWQNNDPKGNCAICFEKMDRTNSTQLRCQHVFHTGCIKTWLQTDGICPICRSFVTLDVEFPPLK